MRATGIVRRVDDLGRVVIPKEIRKYLGIEEGTPLEIYVDKEKSEVIFSLYKTDTIQNVRNLANQVETFASDYGDWDLGADLRAMLLGVANRLEKLESSY